MGFIWLWFHCKSSLVFLCCSLPFLLGIVMLKITLKRNSIAHWMLCMIHSLCYLYFYWLSQCCSTSVLVTCCDMFCWGNSPRVITQPLFSGHIVLKSSVRKIVWCPSRFVRLKYDWLLGDYNFFYWSAFPYIPCVSVSIALEWWPLHMYFWPMTPDL